MTTATPQFHTSSELFPIKTRGVFLSGCSVSPMSPFAYRAERAFLDGHFAGGYLVFRDHPGLLRSFHESLGALLDVSSEDVALTKNSTEGLSLIANGYPLLPGDEIITYEHEYPANMYPWIIQERRGARVIRLPNRNTLGVPFDGLAVQWTWEDLEAALSPRTRIIALSHVQFTSGFAADLARLGEVCRARGIDLIVDAAQSLGCMPIRPEAFGIDALVSSGWKWLQGPVGSGVLYIAPKLRAKLEIIFAGPEAMRQQDDYLNHTWNPVESTARFEYSTVQYSYAAALNGVIREQILPFGIEKVWSRVCELQNIFRERLTQLSPKLPLALFPPASRSGILSVVPQTDAALCVRRLEQERIFCTTRAGYLRIAPQTFLTDSEAHDAAEIIARFAVSE